MEKVRDTPVLEPREEAGDARRGVILIAVLWAIVLVSALALATSTAFRTFTGLMSVEAGTARLNGILVAGLETAAGFVASIGEAPLRESETEFNLAGARIRMHISDEGGRIDLGKAPAELITSLFASFIPDGASEIARRLMELRDTPGLTPFTSVEQVAGLLQIPDAAAARLAPLVTVFGRETINPFTAPAEVLAVVPGLDRARAAQFVAVRERSSRDAERMLAMLGPGQRFLSAARRQAVTVRISARSPRGLAASARASIVMLSGDSEPYRVLAWSSDLSEQPDAPDGRGLR